MGEVYHLVGSLKCNIKGSTIRGDSFINFDTLSVEFTLECIDVLVVRLEVEETNFAVLAIAAKTLDHTLRNI